MELGARALWEVIAIGTLKALLERPAGHYESAERLPVADMLCWS